MKILVTGVGGQLGYDVCRRLTQLGIEHKGVDVQDFDLTNADAVMDAVLGAAALGDIGLHFPDTSDEFKGADSKLLLARCVELLREKGYAVGNVDCTISMQRPKLRPHIDRMRETIARTIGIDTDAVSVKATTTERLGFEGREEGVSVAAVALIYRE